LVEAPPPEEPCTTLRSGEKGRKRERMAVPLFGPGKERENGPVN
jgi:hypothetical protein